MSEPIITSGGEQLSISEIMQRYRTDGSCERIVRQALASLVERAELHRQVREAVEAVYVEISPSGCRDYEKEVSHNRGVDHALSAIDRVFENGNKSTGK